MISRVNHPCSEVSLSMLVTDYAGSYMYLLVPFLWFHRQVDMCWNAACGMPVLGFVLVTRKQSGVPIFPKGSSFYREYGDLGSPKFCDTSIKFYWSQYEFFCKIKSLRRASWRVLRQHEAWHCDTMWYWQDTWPAICSPLFTLVVSLTRSLMCCSTNSCSY